MQIFCRTNFNTFRIVKSLHEYGYAVVDSYLDSIELANFTAAYLEVFNLSAPEADIVPLDNGYLYNVHQSLLKRFPVFNAFFELYKKPELVEIAVEFMQASFPYSAPAVNEVFEVEYNNREGSTHGSHLHFDRVPSLKMVVYLEDTSIVNGALRVVPATQMLTRKASLEQLRINPNPLSTVNFLHEVDQFTEIHLEGKAGSLVILDTFCLHGGGIIQKNGGSRSSVRGVSWARPLNYNYFLDKAPDFARCRPDNINLSFFHPVKTYRHLPPHDQGSMYRVL